MTNAHSEDSLKNIATIFIQSGSSVTKAARAAGVPRTTMQSRVDAARLKGYLEGSEFGKDYQEAVKIETEDSAPIVTVKPRLTIIQRPEAKGVNKRILAIGDAHDSPHIPDKSRFYALGKYARDNDIDKVIQIGDFASLDSLSRHDANDTLKGREKPSFDDDMLSFSDALSAFHDGLGGRRVEKHVVLGNHEDRIWSFTNRNPEVVHILDNILYQNLNMYGWTYSPFGELYFEGDVAFTHVPLNTMGKAYGGMHCENQIARDSLHDIVFGHTHKRLDKTFPKLGGQSITVINLGCALPDGHIEDYAKHSLTGWSYGAYDITIKDGKISERTWIPMGKLKEEYSEGYKHIEHGEQS